MIKFGIDILLRISPIWKNKRIGLVTNQAALTNNHLPSREALLKNNFTISKLFSPEHGLDILGADGHEIKDGIDGLTSLPIISLYSNKLAPSKEDLEDIDIILFDIPDIGSRFYTYLWTMTYVMEACAKNKKKLIILDRPNPISGNLDLSEGPFLNEAQSSFIGRWSIPIRHCCTLGELALYFNAVKKIQCDLEIITCGDWDRNSFQSDWGIPFVPTSPAIQIFEAMLLYPGLCLLEATNISEGRGTDHSFSLAGAPWLKGESIAGILNDMGFDEVIATPTIFKPDDINGKYYKQNCGGLRLRIREPRFFQPVYFGLLLIRLIKQLYPNDFEWKPYPTLVNPPGKNHLDKLLGFENSENLFDLPLPKFIREITLLTQSRTWKQEIGNYLLY